MSQHYDYLIIGSGIMGLAIAREVKHQSQDARVLVLDKEPAEAAHASGRNSGVLHAGFYYTTDSLKAQFTVTGNRLLKQYCCQHSIPVNLCGKLVVAQNEKELGQLYELERRGKRNGAKVEIVDEYKASEIEPNVRTFKKALYSPDTASVDPKLVCAALRKDLTQQGVEFLFGTKYLGHLENVVRTTAGEFNAGKIINCAGLYADRIAKDFGFGKKYTIIPFKGIYWKYTKNKTDVRVNIYPVPNLQNPFLGVHFTKTASGEIKIGPTAIPAFWRENYERLANFSFEEFVEICAREAQLFAANSFGFRDLALEEMKKYNNRYMVDLASHLVRHIDPEGFTERTLPGIRAQLLETRNRQLVQDFVVEGDRRSIHVLNAVSPAFTCAFPFALYLIDKYEVTS
ncbi:MAG: FAD-dependent oxidoreductase [Omnitrophica WOR_2 bacterium RIFCSPHIGHO2_01_FULL_52_10]|nr:MAG: FAD-dependent oxidoreductase [Omnitrophica WOR_2 bacterium RIFCSPHIGHO2_01_FULL_52_10]